ncbi:MAG: GNAT family N-acetyltransferase [Deltaproteobacteria bacterium]|nr:GNAT family N-acetyltransferase [Deltaproteobacteria bacterium]MBI3293501.1 GNAT family N-acetyltransferase [Deltaproteobacteria bacterium]
MDNELKLVKVFATEMEALKQYIEELYRHDEDYDSMVNIEEGVKSLLKNEQLATPFFIKSGEERVGYVILTRYHSVEKGGLTVYIDELYVENRMRRKGVGKVILAKVFEVARGMGAKTVWAQAEPYNTAAQQFFRSNGFQPNQYLNFERPL